MSVRVTCTTGCGASVSMISRPAASEAGWVFAELVAKGRNRYHVLCPECAKFTKWVGAALAEPKKEKAKDG